MPTMKAAVVRAYGEPLSLEEVPVPEVPPGQILVKVAACGVCHTDLHAADGDWPVKPPLPFIPGHEGAGHVAAVGAGVRGIREGDRVGVPWLHTACGHCEHCLTGWETLCDGQQMTGYTVNGGFAEYVLADPAYVGQLPDGLSFESLAPILCAGVTAYKGLKTWKTLYLLVLDMLQATDPEKFAALPETERFISNRGKPLLSSNEHDLRLGEKLDSGLYAEINLSANSLLKYIKELLEHFGLDPRTMKIYIREDRDADK